MSDKPFTTYEQQIEKLIKKKHIKVENKEYAIRTLRKISYFALINGYKCIFKDNNTNRYKENVCFEDIVSMYEFDQRLRNLLIRYILIIERQMKSLISYYFTETFSESQFEYLNVNNYDYQRNNLRLEINKFVMAMSKVIQSENEIYIKHSRENHNNVPLWVLTNALTFGTISKMYSLMQQRVKHKIISDFPNITKITQLGAMLRILTKFRNVCAHNERLYNYKTQMDILPDLEIYKILGIKKLQDQFECGIRDVFAVVIIFKYMLDTSDFNDFFGELQSIIIRFSTPSNSVTKDDLLIEMGFPQNWECILNIKLS